VVSVLHAAAYRARMKRTCDDTLGSDAPGGKKEKGLRASGDPSCEVLVLYSLIFALRYADIG
jgi:hypothetical protein